VLAYEMTGREIHDLFAFDRGVEREIKILDGFQIAELRRLDSFGESTVISHGDLILKHELQELQRTELVTGRFLNPDIKGIPDPGKMQPFEVINELRSH
jgi:hypothetical protein